MPVTRIDPNYRDPASGSVNPPLIAQTAYFNNLSRTISGQLGDSEALPSGSEIAGGFNLITHNRLTEDAIIVFVGTFRLTLNR
jgi:hypothetical protein